MRSIVWILSLILVLIGNTLSAQIGLVEDFDDNILSTGWTGSGFYTLSESNQELNVQVNTLPSNSYNVFTYELPSTLDLSSNPYLTIKVKASSNIRLRIDLEDADGRATNSNALNPQITGNNTYQTITYNFTGRFSQTWPTTASVNAAQIERLIFFVNPGGNAFNGTFYLDDLLLGDETGILPPPEGIKLNQIGFYPNAPKTAVVVTNTATEFNVVSEDQSTILYTGTLSSASSFSLTGETVKRADFTDFKTLGKYYIQVPGIGYSYPFEIKEDVHHEVSKAALKSFYYQRASMAIQAPHAGIWTRAMGHPDNQVLVHKSASNSFRPENTVISSPRGWYDAGDYNKYIITAGISTFMFLSMYEHYPSYFDTLNLNIPESGNNIPDVLDEALWEIRWMLTMQDPSDGGVYHKLTSPNFDGSVMPSASNQVRYVVKKGTAATLDFAATMAQAARIFKVHESQLPGLADSCIHAAEFAWQWARKNPAVQYIQSQLDPADINTGEYGNANFTDEFQWAAMELYASTKIDSFYTLAGALTNINPPSWPDVRALGYLTLSHLRKNLTPLADTIAIKQRLLNQANYLRERATLSPYGISMYDSWNFVWGSNSTAATQGVMLLHAFDLTKDSSYLKVAIADLDYILGRNGNNICYVTGYGSISPMNIHHRISRADNIEAPIPGLLAGGPNIDAQNDCGPSSYPSGLAAKSYLDSYCSYSTNEVAINWNAPLSYLSNVIEAIESGAKRELLDYETLVLSTEKNTSESFSNIKVYPNPTKDILTIEFYNNNAVEIQLTNVHGNSVMNRTNKNIGEQLESFNLSGLSKGIYFLFLKSENKTESRKVVVE